MVIKLLPNTIDREQPIEQDKDKGVWKECFVKIGLLKFYTNISLLISTEHNHLFMLYFNYILYSF